MLLFTVPKDMKGELPYLQLPPPLLHPHSLIYEQRQHCWHPSSTQSIHQSQCHSCQLQTPRKGTSHPHEWGHEPEEITERIHEAMWLCNDQAR